VYCTDDELIDAYILMNTLFNLNNISALCNRFCAITITACQCCLVSYNWILLLHYATYHILSGDSLVYSLADDKVTVLESERRAWESSPEAQAIREALNPWRNHDTEQRKNA